MLGEQIGVFTVMICDAFLAGRVSKEATAAVGAGAYMGWFVSLAFSLVGAGTGAIVARSFGARDLRSANRTLNQSVAIALALGVVVTLVVFIAAPLGAALLTQTPAAQRMFTQYVRIDCIGYMPFMLFLICGAVLRAAGDTRTPMFIIIVINIVNAALSAGLVFGWLGLPRLGVAGIAIGTVVARAMGGAISVGLFLRGMRSLRLDSSALEPDMETIRRILRVGLPAAADSALMWIGQFGFLIVVAHTAAGDAATVNFAAHTIAIRMESVSFLPAVAWMTAAATLVGQYLGAQRPDLARRAGHIAALQASLLTTSVGVFFFVGSEWIYRVMSADPQVRSVGGAAFRFIAFAQPILGMAIVYIGALRGAGDTKATMVFSLIGGLGLRIPVAWFCGVYLHGGLIGAWFGMWADNLAKFAMGLGRFIHGGWKNVRV